ncbi:DUF86 domain-containing protein [Cohnella pontilimi]|uniref:DUF86 domain-containing protein n=1 Tax=Cohnella pontilimi TaxID=2564100 RepID=A0A4U0FCQ0_9BACL|nr:DUF86 domain-containing protein [Cohnella pontilimi]TJY42458.1 DUF86 domain-containing protein [Cohnella pontilimi]
MSRRYVMYLTDILESINRIETYTEGIDFDSFCCNRMMFDAVIRNLEVIGEAARSMPEEVKAKYPEIPWRQMIGLRNILIHEYFGVDESIIWEIIKKDLKETKQYIVKAVQEGGDFT